MDSKRTAKPVRGVLKMVGNKEDSSTTAVESERAQPERNGMTRKLLITNIIEHLLGRPWAAV
ncbi:hypothetical protein, partial [Mycolicibacterium peregrinum]|uniref:hypothetical protein n=1 Tax=Mycolicibacterium peregrinum TaxID=43304 RepID=UPI003AAD80EE